jgi:hypothetical protein
VHENTIQPIPQSFGWLPNHIINDSRLSWKAKGLLLYLNNQPHGWKFTHAELIDTATDGKGSVQSGVNELKAAGYLSVDAERGDDGTVAGWIWRVTVPDDENRDVVNGKPPPDFSGIQGGGQTPDPDYPDPDNPRLDFFSELDGQGTRLRPVPSAHVPSAPSPPPIVPPSPHEKTIAEQMHLMVVHILFDSAHRKPVLSDQRRRKYLALYHEHLHACTDPFQTFKLMCEDIRDDDFLSKKREFQYPESWLRNPERRERHFIHATKPTTHHGVTLTENGYVGRQPWL